MEILKFPAKRLRAEVIANYIRATDQMGVVVFGCGNGARDLRAQGVDVLDISPEGDVAPTRWWTPAEIAREWPRRFDATSGHLPLHLMVRVAGAFRAHLGALPSWKSWGVPSGSGETILCLFLAYPTHMFTAIYGEDHATQFNEQAPLNAAVKALVDWEHMGIKTKGERNR